jgi:hypothetical protein
MEKHKFEELVPITAVQDPKKALSAWDNILITGNINLTAVELKIMLFLTSHITKKMKILPEAMRFNTMEFCEAIGLANRKPDRKSDYGNTVYFEKALQSLKKKCVFIENKRENSISGMNWLDYYKIWRKNHTHDVKLLDYCLSAEVREKYQEEEYIAFMAGNTEFRIGKELAPFLVGLNEEFTTLEIRYILSMDSIYAMRIYMLCKKSLGSKQQEYDLEQTIDWWRRKLGIEKTKYHDWRNFYRRVFTEPITKYINGKTDISIDISHDGKGRHSAKRISLNIKRISMKEVSAVPTKARPADPLYDLPPELRDRYKLANVTPKTIRAEYAEVGNNMIAYETKKFWELPEEQWRGYISEMEDNNRFEKDKSKVEDLAIAKYAETVLKESNDGDYLALKSRKEMLDKLIEDSVKYIKF